MDDSGKQVSWLVALSPRVTFPGRALLPKSSGLDARRTTYSCGGSPGFTPEFPLNPLGGELVARREDEVRAGLRQVSEEFLRRRRSW